MVHTPFPLLAAAAMATLVAAAGAQEGDDVPVTIKELDLEAAIREFQQFRDRLGEYRTEIVQGQDISRETSQILEELRATASEENDYNEGPILEAITAYVDGVVAKQVALVDFLESQRYRISYYANKMAASVRPEDLALLFGTPEQNDAAITVQVQELGTAREAIADFVDALPEGQIDRATFRPTREMPRETRQQLDSLLQQYQFQKNGLELAKKRLQLVRAAERGAAGPTGPELEIDADLLVGQMFGALDRVRLQMSMDMLFLEQMLQSYSRTARTQEILEAFQSLVELQGDLEGPSTELSGIIDWLRDSSARRLRLGTAGFRQPGLDIPKYSDLLREAYQGARGEGE